MVCDGHAEAVRAMGFQRKAGQTLLTGKRKSFQRVWESLQAEGVFQAKAQKLEQHCKSIFRGSGGAGYRTGDRVWPWLSWGLPRVPGLGLGK